MRPQIRAYVRPADRGYEPYQLYYREGLRLYSASTAARYDEMSMTRFPRLLGQLRKLHATRTVDAALRRVRPARRVVEASLRALEGQVETPSGHFHDGVGQYVIALSGKEVGICLDSTDYAHIPHPELLAWCNVYFKANKWIGDSYPSKVAPIVNGDPFILNRFPYLRRMRETAKEYDICLIVRVWGGRTGLEGVEHNLRILEAIAASPGRKFILAILAVGDRKSYARRLRAHGIRSTTRAVSPDEIWNITGDSRLNVIRLGMHHCIPWRMAGSLALGSCIVLDRPPLSDWPQPLLENENYLSLDLETDLDSPVAPEESYARIPELVEAWLRDDESLRRIGRTNAEYFDTHVAPAQVGRYIYDSAVRSLPSG